MLLPLQRASRSALLLAILASSLYVLYSYRSGVHLFRSSTTTSNPDTVDPLYEARISFWSSIYPNIVQNKPQCEPFRPVAGNPVGYDSTKHDELRPDRLAISPEQATELRSSHQRFTAHLVSANYTLPFTHHTRGIVTTAGGQYLPVALLSLRMLRATGSQLPVEVFLASHSEWDSQICGIIFPTLNARCIVLEDIFNPSGQEAAPSINKYQYKIMSILFSSFEEVLFLDSDCFPVFDPSVYFKTKPFRTTGMIRWPDFWFPSEHSQFFDIAGIPQPELWAQASTESGELFYAKKNHTNSLLLALYYNIYGPDFYYPLQSQGNPGEGDKETFMWSAVAFNETFHSVQKPVQALGYRSKAGDWRGSAMIQFDPLEDLHNQKSFKSPAVADEDRGKMPVRPAFVHVNFPKIDPGSIFDDVSFGVTGPTKDTDGRLRRIWHEDAQGSIAYFGYDLERKLWEVVKEIACEYEETILAWQGKTAICERATQYWDTVFAKEISQPISG
ncbi:hypothetical protein PV10_05349 [Exophiala mesophila]|uniref:Alpha-1,2-mannosyltransferase n=1 Tax=Exophiala mesophila TaxID=212818 RepID=A0A0D1ZV66_EXOME|nr:uncharacterized protein PV10_05349 [Exophiala mesophila]KIV90723.1 hypothetical protein PV10_05349 [Exophiala mesophila]